MEKMTDILKVIEVISDTSAEENNKTTLPVSRYKISTKHLTGKDERLIKNSFTSLYKIHETLYNIFYNKIETENKWETYEDFVKNVSMFDTNEIAKSILSSTYMTIDNPQIVCAKCGHQYNEEKVEYNNIKNNSKTWDKDTPFTQHRYIHNYNYRNKVNIIFHLKLPSIYDYLGILSYTATNTEPTTMDITDLLKMSSIVDTLLLYTDKLQIINSDDEYVFDKLKDIELILQKLDLNILHKVLDNFNKEYEQYIPTYSYTSVCPKCKNENVLSFYPLEELLSRI